ncbi:MAG: hypothetical protein LKJ83_00215 [Eubacteriaceae bacterium]|nr:hypothetical protein [Eubacteriaceae bacterium]
MEKIYVAEDASGELKTYLKQKNFAVVEVHHTERVGKAVSAHPDIYMCRLGTAPGGEVFHGDPEKLTPEYPGDVRYNAACTGRYFIHKLSVTDPELLRLAEQRGLEMIDVHQGYTKCSTVIVDEESIITADEGIAAACAQKGMAVMSVAPGHVVLPGFPYGFIGGAAGRVGDEIIFNGDLTGHPDSEKMIDFIRDRGAGVKWFSGYPLTDIGTIL